MGYKLEQLKPKLRWNKRAELWMHKYIQQVQRNNVIYVDSRKVARAFCLLNFAEFYNSENIAIQGGW